MVFFLFSSAFGFLLEIPTFDPKFMNEFVLEGDAGPPMNGRISLERIKNPLIKDNKKSSGALILTRPVLVDSASSFTFQADFIFLITKTSEPYQNQGEGFSFFLAPNALAYSTGAYPYGLPSAFLAVTFDTSVSKFDGTINNNINIFNSSSFDPISKVTFNSKLNSGEYYRAWVDYGFDPTDSQNTIWVYISDNLYIKPSTAVVVQTYNVLENEKLYFGFSGNSPSMSNENHFIFTWRLAVSITTSKNKKGNIDSKFVIIVTVSVAVGGIVIIAFVCYILWKSKTFRDFLQGFKIRSSGYVDKLKRSSSMRLLLGDPPSAQNSNLSFQNPNPEVSDRNSSVHGHNTGGSDDDSITPTSEEVTQPRNFEMVQKRRIER
jgi:hypothetical protein